MSHHFVEVKLDPSLRSAKDDPTPKTEIEKITWPLLDTAYNLIREAAVRVALEVIRAEAREDGVDIGTDEELFQEARESGLDGAPTGYADLAPDNALAASGFYTIFELLSQQALADAAAGMEG